MLLGEYNLSLPRKHTPIHWKISSAQIHSSFQRMQSLQPTTSEEIENRGFTLKTHQMFPVHTTPAGSPVILD